MVNAAKNPPVAIAVIVILFWAWAVGTCRANAPVKGRSVTSWTVIGLLLGPLAVLALNLLPAVRAGGLTENWTDEDPIT